MVPLTTSVLLTKTVRQSIDSSDILRWSANKYGACRAGLSRRFVAVCGGLFTAVRLLGLIVGAGNEKPDC
jgi:uncharacterized protein YqgC (DUF456 family)